MRKFVTVLLLASLIAAAAAGDGCARPGGTAGTAPMVEGIMGYCTLNDLEESYGVDRIAGWSRLDPVAVDRAISRATAEIDGYLVSGGYAVPLAGPPENIKKYCIDIAVANLVINAGILEADPGGKAVVEEAKNARRYLGKVAEGAYKIPGYVTEGEVAKPPSGGVQITAGNRLDWKGY
jgi:phage gp36-like protein